MKIIILIVALLGANLAMAHEFSLAREITNKTMQISLTINKDTLAYQDPAIDSRKFVTLTSQLGIETLFPLKKSFTTAIEIEASHLNAVHRAAQASGNVLSATLTSIVEETVGGSENHCERYISEYVTVTVAGISLLQVTKRYRIEFSASKNVGGEVELFQYEASTCYALTSGAEARAH